MIISSPFVIILSADEHHQLTSRAGSARTAHRDVIRARIILAAAQGVSNTRIAADLGIHVDTVRKWRRRFWQRRLAGLVDLPRSGRPRIFSAVQVAEVKALACELPTEAGLPLGKWSCPDLSAEAERRGVVVSLSASTVRRWLAADAIKPWQHRSWIFPRDADFAAKAGRVLDLYARTFDAESLSADEYVISADEKPGVQARERIHPSRPPRPGRQPMRVESEYRRHGTLAYLLRRPPSPSHRPLRTQHRHRALHRPGHQGDDPRALRQRATGVLDRRQRLLPSWLDRRRPTHRRVPECDHDPHPGACVLAEPDRNLFSVVQRKLLTPDNVAGLEPLAEQITAFEARYNQAAQPFDWRFNRDDLDRLLDRIAA